MQAIVKVESPGKRQLPDKMSDWKTIHLPDGALPKWRTVFITTFAAYIGTKRAPWNLRNQETIDAMQDCWDHVYQSTTIARHKITGHHNIVFILVGILALVICEVQANGTCRVINDGRSYETLLESLPSGPSRSILCRSGL
jgi:hypothetical protein